MKKLFTITFALIALALPLSAQPTQGSISTRLANLEAPLVQTIASNATTVQIDFRQGAYQDGTNGVVAGEEFYTVKNLANALALQLTNIVPGVTRRVFITTDGTARAITVSTNGVPTQTRLSYNFTATTNGATTFTATNRAFINFTAQPAGEVYSTFGWIQ